MATDDVQRLVTGTAAAPANFTIPGNGQMRPKAIYALFTGTGAGTPYLPALKITSDAGKLVGVYPTCASVAAGGSAGVSWFPGIDDCCCATSSSGGSGSITSLTSPQGTLAVANPTGPLVNVDMPATGVSAGSYGDASHSAQISLDAEGRVTTAASVAIAGGSGTIGFEVGYDEITTGVTIASTSEAAPTTIITCASHTFDGAPVLLHFFAPFVQNATVGVDNVIVSLWESGSELTRLGLLSVGTPNQVAVFASLFLRFTPSAAAHTYVVQAHAGNLTGGPAVGAGNGSGAAYPPAFVRFTKV